MPTYAYACKDCDHAFETVQSFSDASLTVCPECSGTLRKKFNSVGVGFYRTDSRSGGSSVPAGSSSSSTASSSSTSSSTSSSDKAPAAAAS